MQTIHVHNIEYGDRIRKSFSEEKIEELKQSIIEKGLYQAPVLQNDGRTLVMGENRIRAIIRIYDEEMGPIFFNGEEIPHAHIPFTYLSDMEEDDILEAELEENILRQDLTWQEEVEAKRRLHELRVSQYGEYSPHPSGGEGWSVRDTAKEVHGEDFNQYQLTKTSEDLRIAEHLDDPNVANAKTRKDALKAIEKKKKEEWRQQQAERVASQDTDHHQLLQGDAFELLPTFDSEYFDVICTDPPYGINIDKQQQRDGEYHEYDDSSEILDSVAELLANEGHRITKPEAHLYMFCDIRKWPSLAAHFWLAGWEVWDRPLIWYKGNTGSFGGTDWGPRRTYEAILYAAKGRRPVTALYHDVAYVSKPSQTTHPAGKPDGIFEDLLRRSLNPGERVLDPFCGAAPVFAAAERLYAYAVGIELHQSYHAMAAEKLQEIRNYGAIQELANE